MILRFQGMGIGGNYSPRALKSQPLIALKIKATDTREKSILWSNEPSPEASIQIIKSIDTPTRRIKILKNSDQGFWGFEGSILFVKKLMLMKNIETIISMIHSFVDMGERFVGDGQRYEVY